MNFNKILNIFNNLFKASQSNQLQVDSNTQEKLEDVNCTNPSILLPDALFNQPESVSFAKIPLRPHNSMTGKQFIANNMNLGGSAREKNIVDEICSGNIPDFLRNFVPVKMGAVTFFVMPDFLSIGSDEDYVRIPMTPLSAQKIADAFECTLPTKRMVDLIWRDSSTKVSPMPWGPPYDASIMSTSRYDAHNDKIQKQLNGLGNNFKLGNLLSGHKKDVVLTNRLHPENPNKRVAIYGWIQLNGTPIQGLNPVSHDVNYVDYSHGIRMISKHVLINDVPSNMDEVLKDPSLAFLISEEGVLKFTRY